MDDLKTIAAYFAAIGVTGAMLVTFAFGLFKIFGSKWLDAKFNERLENYRHLQSQELERLKFNINALMDRVTKLHQREFDVLPEVWSRLNDAFGHAAQFVSPFQQYPNLDQMTEPHFEEFLAKSDLAEFQKENLRTSENKLDDYRKIIFWHALHRVRAKYSEFHNYFIKSSIFIQPDLKKKLTDLSNIIFEALLEQEIEERNYAPRAGRFQKSEYLRSEGNKLLVSIGEDVQSRLWDARSID